LQPDLSRIPKNVHIRYSLHRPEETCGVMIALEKTQKAGIGCGVNILWRKKYSENTVAAFNVLKCFTKDIIHLPFKASGRGAGQNGEIISPAKLAELIGEGPARIASCYEMPGTAIRGFGCGAGDYYVYIGPGNRVKPCSMSKESVQVDKLTLKNVVWAKNRVEVPCCKRLKGV
jgi:hypothetical protein